MNRPATLLVELMGEEIIDKFLFEIMSEQTSHEIRSFIMMKLNELQIRAVSSDIGVQMLTETQSLDIFISEELENRLLIFENLNPEYFI